MSNYKHEMLSLLKELKSRHSVVSVKAEFEAEGTRLYEAVWLKDIADAVDVQLSIKIGGCENIRDMYDVIDLSANNMIAPMIETPYAMQKYLQAVKKVFHEHSNIKIYANIETITACDNFSEMLNLQEIDTLHGIVIGRVDLSSSLGMDRKEINSDKMFKIVKDVVKKANEKNLRVVIGGAVSFDSLSFFRNLPENTIEKYETRKIVFSCPEALNNTKETFRTAIQFELLWLKYKRDHYIRISLENQERIYMLENRQKSLDSSDEKS